MSEARPEGAAADLAGQGGLPSPNLEPNLGPEAAFAALLRQGRFCLQRSRSTGRYAFYPRVALPGTGETDLEWVDAAGTGTVYAITVKRDRSGSGNIALIDVDEGVRMMSRIEGVETLPIGARVRARIAEIDGAPAVVFDPAGPA